MHQPETESGPDPQRPDSDSSDPHPTGAGRAEPPPDAQPADAPDEASAPGDQSVRRWGSLWQPNGFTDAIPRPVRLAAAWSLRLIAIGVGAYAGLWLLTQLGVVAIPGGIGLLVAALLTPAVGRMRRLGMPHGLAPGVAFVGGLLVLGGLVALIVQELVASWETMVETVTTGIQRLVEWLGDSPLQLDADELNKGVEQALDKLKDNPTGVVSGTVDVVSTASGALAGFALAAFTAYFLLADGHRIWAWTVRLFPRTARERVDHAGRKSWDVLVAYVRVTLFIAVICGLSVYLAALIAGVPLALSVGLVVFLFAFIPVIGGIISSIVVFLLALVTNGLTTAIVVGGIAIIVYTVQGNVLYPALMNRRLNVHPLASLMLVAVGVLLGGVFGALIAVPVAAVVNTAWTHLLSSDDDEDDQPERPPRRERGGRGFGGRRAATRGN